MDNRCVGCGEIVPEGRQVCPNCEKGRPAMRDEEKNLVKLLAECFDKCLKSNCTECDHFNAPPIIGNRRSCQAHLFADYLIANGVTVGKPLSQFLHPVDAYPGLKAKYLVFKGHTGEKVENCFVLRPDKDPAAVEALRAYAQATENETLAQDIHNWVGQGEPVQQWIPVTERLPEMTLYRYEDSVEPTGYGECFVSDKVLVYCPNGNRIYVAECSKADDDSSLYWNDVNSDMTMHPSHWMPLPEPPKGE